MEVDWDRYQDSLRYRLRVSLYYLEKQSPRLRERFSAAAKRSITKSAVILLGAFAVLWLLAAPVGTYGIAMVALGATTLAWTAFRVHEKSFREAALVPDDRKGDTPHQERVSMASLNYVDAAVGVALVAMGFTVQIATSIR